MGLLCCVACASPPETKHVAWPDEDHTLAFLVFRQGELPLRAGAAIALENGRPVFGDEVVRFEEGAEVFLVALDQAALIELSAIVDLGRLQEAELSHEPESCADGRIVEPDRLERHGFPVSRARVFQVDPDAGDFIETSLLKDSLAQLSLTLPVDPELCFESPLVAEPFGADVQVLRDPETIAGEERRPGQFGDRDFSQFYALDAVHRIDEDRLVTAARGALYLFERGEPFVDDAAHVFAMTSHPEDPLDGEWWIWDLAVDPTPVGPGESRVLVATSSWRSSDRKTVRSAILDFTVDADGFRFTRTATIREGGVFAVGFDTTGRLVAGATGGYVLTASSATARFTAFQSPVVDTSIEHVHTTIDPAMPHILGAGTGSVLLGDVSKGANALRVEEVEEVVTTVEALASRRTPEGTEIWATTYTDGLFRRTIDGQWLLEPVHVPDTARPCLRAPDECGRARWAEDPEGLVVTEEGVVYVSINACTTAFRYDSVRGCTAPIVFGDSIRFDRRESASALRVYEDTMLMVGTLGRVWEVRLPPSPASE